MWDFSQPSVTFDNPAYRFDGGAPVSNLWDFSDTAMTFDQAIYLFDGTIRSSSSRFGYAEVVAVSQTGIQGVRSAYIEGSACLIDAEFFDSAGELFVPSGLRYRIDDVKSGAVILNWTPITPASSLQVTLSAGENAMISLSRKHETHQVLFEITDGQSQVNHARVLFDLYRVPGLN